ncbi:MAG: tripartite tricarboxylate transporter permease, partial [Candidatus Diapherotrites archaeon]|nr:tripartite tricarboxylate transporter permease [Candidatus Diapherotrites archaeon]
MFEEFVLWTLLGIVSGIFTGITPGIHINTVAVFLLGLSGINPVLLAVFITSLSITHVFFDFIPSILFGVPSDSNFLFLLPGQRLFLQGKAFLAIKLSLIGSFVGVIFTILSFSFYGMIFRVFFSLIKFIVPWLLIFVLLLIVWFEKGVEKKFWSVFVILSSGALGWITLRNFVFVENNLFVSITGFFAISSLLFSFKSGDSKIVFQKLYTNSYSKLFVLKDSFFGFLAGMVVSIFPGIGPSVAGFFVTKVFGKMNAKQYITMLGSTGSSNMLFSFFAL